jgi:hypothetical protein
MQEANTPPDQPGRAPRALRSHGSLVRTFATLAALGGTLAFSTPGDPAPTTADPTPAGALADAAALPAAVLAAVPGAVVEAGVEAVGAAASAASLLDPTLEPLRGLVRGSDAYQEGRAALSLRIDGQPVPYSVLALTALPGATLQLDAAVEDRPETLVLRHASGVAVAGEPGHWSWTAPEHPGIHALEVSRSGSDEAVRVHVLVTHARTLVRDETLNGFRIGRYVETPLNGRDAYLPPEGFVEVMASDEDVLVSPHFTLGQFLCKQEGDPRYLAFSTPLAIKLEAVLEATNRAGIAAGTLHVMSGFRTPWYNRAIGNTTDYSRHLWGDAADVYVDVDGDGDMDDLDGNGRSDMADARRLAAIVEEAETRGRDALGAGGLGVYDRTSAHGPFVHVDARGYAARW